jgi:signal peptidase I
MLGTRSGFTDARDREPPLVAKKSLVRELLETVLLCVVFVLFLRAFVFQQSEIPSASMENTILIGDHVLVNRFLYAPTSFDWERRILPIRDLRRGDVVVFMHPPGPEQDFIKRVIGLPGETLALSNGTLLIDGLPVDEPYLDADERVGQTYGPVYVEPGSYFLLGDNRSRSADSREWGAARRQLIKGRAFMILFSTSAAAPEGSPPGQVSAKSLLRKLFNLVFHSRWERCLSLVR